MASGDLGAERPAPGDGGEHLFRLGRRNDLHQVGVGEQRRIFQDRRRDQIVQVLGQRQHDEFGNAVEGLDFLRQDRTDARRLVARQPLERRDGQALDVLALVAREARHQARDLARQLGAHVVVGIVGKVMIGGRGRRGIGGDGAAGRRRAVAGEVVEHLGSRIGAAGEFALRRLGANLQSRQGLVARHSRHGFFCWHPGPFRRTLRLCAWGRLPPLKRCG
ncbi:MAG: hypothetical protein WDN08_07525 [Rhizomicrobium sp.]